MRYQQSMLNIQNINMLELKLIRDLKIGDTIEALKFNKKVKGKIVKLHPGAVVIINERNGEREVVDSDRITKTISNEKK